MLGKEVVVMPRWNDQQLKFVEVSSSAPARYPVMVRRKTSEVWECRGAPEHRCQPAGQCVHMELCKELKLLPLWGKEAREAARQEAARCRQEEG